MPDRTIRDELLDSDRWLGLPSDSDRLGYVGLLLRCDDFGNLEGGPRRLYRFLQAFTQIKTEEAAATLLLHLADADLLRRYEIEKREFFHLPRLRPHRWYVVRKCPPSPWDDPTIQLGKAIKKIAVQGLAKTLNDISHTDGSNIALAVAVDVAEAVAVNQTKSNTGRTRRDETLLPDDWSLPDEWHAWAVSFGMQPERAWQVAADFRDYWIAKPRKEAVRRNWKATWCRWVRTTLEKEQRNARLR